VINKIRTNLICDVKRQIFLKVTSLCDVIIIKFLLFSLKGKKIVTSLHNVRRTRIYCLHYEEKSGKSKTFLYNTLNAKNLPVAYQLSTNTKND